MSAEPRPPLAMRLRPPRLVWIVLDWIAAALCWVLVFGVLVVSHGQGPRSFVVLATARSGLIALLALGLAAPVAFRRRAPERALVVTLACGLISLLAGYELTRGAFLPLGFVLYQVASACRRTVAVAGLGASLLLLLAVQGTEMHFSGQGSGNAVAASLVLTIVWLVGYSVQQRRDYLAQVRDWAASDAVTRERLRIARELHDVVAHSMTVVTVQAGFGEYVFDTQPAQARAALSAIGAVSREALGEMQRLLCVLRQTGTGPVTSPAGTGTAPPSGAVPGRARAPAVPGAPAIPGEPADAGAAAGPAGTAAGGGDAERHGEAAPLAPVPGLDRLDRLVERTAGAGVQVTVERTGRVRSVPPGIDLSAYRIVQEALTNVVKHSGAARCRVLVDYGLGALLVQVTDDGPGQAAPVGAGGAAILRPAALPQAGHGIVGMRERVSLCGGEFSAAPQPGGGFCVRARLPLPAAS